MKPLQTCLKKLGLSDTVFFKENGKEYTSFETDVKKKIDIIQPNAYFVFNKQPMILFFDLTIERNQKREHEIHKQVWSFDNSPIAFIIKENEVIIYNALSYSKENKCLEEIELTEEERIEQFSFWKLQSGSTWKWLQNEYLGKRNKKQYHKRVNERLFQNIKEVREYLLKNFEKKPLTEQKANSLILRLIFIRYLIDRGVRIDDNFISGKNKNEKRLSLIQLIKQPTKLNQLFIKLNNKFNGVLFKEFDFVLTQDQSNYLAKVFKGEVQEASNLFEGFFFEIFDFSIIPVEVISGIYESLIDEETKKLDAAIYTPPFLVEYVLNDTVEHYLNENNTSECKIFEVAVGSGIFLVQSLRKMIIKEIQLKGTKNKKRFSNRIREITKNNLFGIDINKEALKVTCFSIYIALLDYQNPKDIDTYEFPDLLNENLFEANFFDTDHKFNDVINKVIPKFILGNPPWKGNKKDAIHINWLKNNNKTVGRYEIAQSFLLRSKDFMHAETKAALLVTSTIFYNVSKTTRKFKEEFLTTFCIEKFFDLSPVRRLIFEKKNSPVSIVFYRLSNEKEFLTNIVKHNSVKTNQFLKNFKMLVIEKFDQKEILQKHFIENEWMFKAALYGNTLDFSFLKRISSLKLKVEDLIDNRKIFCGDGILKGTPKKEPFTFLVGLPYIENNEVRRYYTPVKKNRILKIEDTYLESGRKLNKFVGHHIYLKNQTLNETELVISYNGETAVNKHDVTTITSRENPNELKYLYSILISKLHVHYQFLSSSAWGVSTRPAIKLKEYLALPIVKPKNKSKTELILLINQFLKPFKEYYKQEIRSESLPLNNTILSEINNIINDLYGVKTHEKDLIDYALNVSRYQFQESRQHLVSEFTYSDKTHYRNRNLVLENYASIFLNEFKKIYKDEYLQVEIYPLDHFIALNFVFTAKKTKSKIVYPKDKKGEKEVLKQLANNLSISQITNTEDLTKNLFIQKDIKGFEKNSFYIIKPNEYKCWHKAIAWYDVAEFKAAIEKAELKSLNLSNAT